MSSLYGPARIVCLQPSATVILDEIGALDRIVACTRYCADVVPSITTDSRQILADSWTANAEQIMAANPDLVIAAVPYQEKAVSEILKSGARFLGLAPSSLADIYVDIETIAGAVGLSERGHEVISKMRASIDRARQKTAGPRRSRVFCEEWGKPIIASQHWVAELVEAAGGEFVATPGQQVTADEIRSLNPEFLIAAWCGAGNRVPIEKITQDRGWQETPAALAGRIFCIRDEFLNTPAPTILRGLDALAFAIHPELFPQPDGIRQITDVSSFHRGECKKVS